MNRNEFIKELEKLGFIKNSDSNSYSNSSTTVFIGKAGISSITFDTHYWDSHSTDFENMLNILQTWKYCNYCGKKIKQIAKFCRYCGKLSVRYIPQNKKFKIDVVHEC